MHLAIPSGRRAQDNLLATCNAGGRGQHQHRAEQGCGAAGNVQAHFLDGFGLLPAFHTVRHLYMVGLKTLGCMKTPDVAMRLTQGFAQRSLHQSFRFLHLLGSDRQAVETYVVEAFFEHAYSLITPFFHLCQHIGHDGVQVGRVTCGACKQAVPRLSGRIFEYSHNIIFSIGTTRIPCAPSSFS